MVVLVALVTMLVAVMAVVMLVAVVVMMVVIMAAAAGGAMGVLVGMRVVMLVAMIMAVAGMGMAMVVVVLMPMVVMMMTMVIMPAIGVIVVVGATLRLERPLDIGHRAALAADHLGQNMVVLDIDRGRSDLGRGVAVADMPGDARQPQRVLGGDLDQFLRRGLDQDERAVVELDGVAIVQCGRLVEIEQDVAPAIALERDAAAIAILMVEGEGLDDPVLLDRGLADDGGGALHDGTRGVMD